MIDASDIAKFIEIVCFCKNPVTNGTTVLKIHVQLVALWLSRKFKPTFAKMVTTSSVVLWHITQDALPYYKCEDRVYFSRSEHFSHWKAAFLVLPYFKIVKMSARSLHYVFRTACRQKTYDFYVKKLGMKILRHEEYGEGCKAGCDGGGEGKWSKTMIGYGPEDDHFVFELTYKYDLKDIPQGNEFGGVVVKTDRDLESTTDPEGYKFIFEKVESAPKNPVGKVILHVEDLEKSIKFWGDVLGFFVNVTKAGERALISFGPDQTALELVAIHAPIKRNTASGRIAFSIPQSELKPLEAKVKEFDEKRVETPFTDLETPGKQTVSVVILTDPDGHEICFVGDENFRKLSQPESNADESLQKAIKEACGKCQKKE
uniref:VOC domain-containing protein n=1 Tax=Panagrellus redivivus TaxID=6233 RepID=A0A7E4V8C1_PANRE